MSEETPIHISFICTGNICRSPYAEAFLRRVAEREGWKDKIRVSSRGTLPLQGIPAHDYALQIGTRNKMNLLSHRSAPLDEEHLATCHLVLCMARDHALHIQRAYPEHQEKVYLLTAYPEHDGEAEAIPDPIGLDKETFLEVFDMIEVSLEPLLNDLRERLDVPRTPPQE
ncbi:MAG: hypothetical protein V3T77_04855 [Planctomycetota bacterium]